MAARHEVVAVVDYNSGLSWRMDQGEVFYWFKRYGVLKAKLLMMRELWRALSVASRSFRRV